MFFFVYVGVLDEAIMRVGITHALRMRVARCTAHAVPPIPHPPSIHSDFQNTHATRVYTLFVLVCVRFCRQTRERSRFPRLRQRRLTHHPHHATQARIRVCSCVMLGDGERGYRKNPNAKLSAILSLSLAGRQSLFATRLSITHSLFTNSSPNRCTQLCSHTSSHILFTGLTAVGGFGRHACASAKYFKCVGPPNVSGVLPSRWENPSV